MQKQKIDEKGGATYGVETALVNDSFVIPKFVKQIKI